MPFIVTGTPTGDTGPYSEVRDHLDWARENASDAFDTALTYISSLSDALSDLNIPGVGTIDPISVDEPDPFQPVASPSIPTTSIILPELPSFDGINDVVFDSVGDAPELTATEPTISSVSVPTDLSASLPSDPTVDTSFDYPTSPDSTLPDVPTLEELSLPTAPTVTFETFSQNLPEWDSSISEPDLTFSFTEDAYSSTLLTDVSNKLISDLQGGTGLPADVEQSIWDRARDREEQLVIKTKHQLLVENKQFGFSRPTGSLLAALQEAEQESQNKISSISRDIAIKQAELEQENLKNAIASSINLEQQLINYTSQRASRALEAAKYLQQAAIDVYDSRIKKINVELEIYKAYAQSFEARVRSELAKVEVYKSQIDAQRLIGEINQQNIQIYVAKIDGIKAAVDIFKTNMDAIATRIQAEKLKVDVFKSQIDSYIAQVQAKESEYNLYSKRIDASLVPLKVYSEKVNAYTSRIKAYASQVDAASTKARAETDIEKLKIDKFTAELNSVLGMIKSQTEVYTAEVEKYRAAAQMYTANVTAESDRYKSQAAWAEAEARIKQMIESLEQRNAELSINRAIQIAQLYLEGVKAQGSVASQLAASSLSGLNIGAHISGSSSDSYNENHNYEE